MNNNGMMLSMDVDVMNPERYRVDHPYPSVWNLEIRNVSTDDAGTYECLVGSQLQVTNTVQLTVAGKTDL